MVFISGCATVNPAPDYERAHKESARGTGNPQLFNPAEAESDARLVESLLAGGLTADEAAQVALLNNPALQASLYDIGAARADLVQAGLLSNPSLGVALRLPAAGGLANIDFDLAQNIADLWQIPIRQRAAERTLTQTILTVARQAAQTSAGAKTAYYDAVGADRQLKIARENVEVGRKVFELTEFRRQAGAGSELDVSLARGVWLESQLALIQARLAAATRRRTLATVLGLAIDADEIVLLDGLPEPPTNTLDDEQLEAMAWDERLDARALRAAVQSAQDRFVLETRRVFPTVSLGLAFEREERSRSQGRDIVADTARASIAAGQLTAPEIEPRSARDVDTDFIIGPSLFLELPIFDQNQAQIAKARYTLEQRLRELAGLERAIHQEVRDAVDQARTAWVVAHFYRDEVVPQATRNLELSRDAYQAGQTSVLSVLDAERAYLSARARYAEAMQQAATAVPNLEQTIGLPFARLLEAAEVQPQGRATTTQSASTTQSVSTSQPADRVGTRGEGSRP